MNIDLSINLDFRVDTDDIEFDDIVGHFNYLSNEFGSLLPIQPDWYETGYSRKQALEHVAFNKNRITEETYQKWLKDTQKMLHYLLKVFGMEKMMIVVVASVTGKCFLMKKTELL